MGYFRAKRIENFLSSASTKPDLLYHLLFFSFFHFAYDFRHVANVIRAILIMLPKSLPSDISPKDLLMKRSQTEQTSLPRWPAAAYVPFEHSPWLDLSSCPREFAKRFFSAGYGFDRSQQREEAVWVYRATIDTLEEWHQRAPQKLSKYLLASLALQHGAHLMRLGPICSWRLREAHIAFRTASLSADSALGDGSSFECAEVLALSLAWLGLSFRSLGNLEDSFLSYRRSAKLWRMLSLFGKSKQASTRPERSLAGVLFGASKTLRLLGQAEEAKRCRSESKTLFQKIRNAVC